MSMMRAAVAGAWRARTLRASSLHTLALRQSSTASGGSSGAGASVGVDSSTSTRSALNAAAAAISDTQAAGLHERMERDRTQRRARLWMIAFVMGSSAAVTIYRTVGQRREQERTLAALRDDVASNTSALQRMQSQQAERQAQVQKLIGTDLAATAAATAAPTSFLAAAVLDVQRALGVVAPDERVHLAPTAAQAVTAVAAQPAAPKPRKAILM